MPGFKASYWDRLCQSVFNTDEICDIMIIGRGIHSLWKITEVDPSKVTWLGRSRDSYLSFEGPENNGFVLDRKVYRTLSLIYNPVTNVIYRCYCNYKPMLSWKNKLLEFNVFKHINCPIPRYIVQCSHKCDDLGTLACDENAGPSYKYCIRLYFTLEDG